MVPESIKNLWFSDVCKGDTKLTLTSTGLILVVYRNYNVYNVLQRFTTINWANKPIYLRFGILHSVFSHSLIPNLETSWWGKNVSDTLVKD